MYRALIVEDEDLMREYLAAKLGELCPLWTAAATAADGMEAVELLAHERFDAILTDIRMPGMDGLELARCIRREDAEIPILVLSGYDEFAYARSAMRLNVFDYLLKPVNEGELSAALSAMAALVAARQDRRGADQLLLALEGDAAASLPLAQRFAGQSCGLMLLCPAYGEESSLAGLFEEARGLGALTVRFPSAVGALCVSRDALLTPTLCRHTLEGFLRKRPDLRLCCGCAPLDWKDGQNGYREAERLLSLAMALDLPFLTEPLPLAQKQAHTRLETMRRLLAEALAQGRLSQERCASLAAALGEFPQSARFSAAMALLEDCAAETEARLAAQKLLGDAGWAGASEAFPQALQTLCGAALLSPPPSSELIQRARDVMQARFAQAISLSSLAEELRVTPAYLSSLFHREMGLSYSQFLLKLRMEDAARRLMENPEAKVYEVGEAVGFPSAKHFAHVFRAYYRLTPKEYRDRNGRGAGKPVGV